MKRPRRVKFFYIIYILIISSSLCYAQDIPVEADTVSSLATNLELDNEVLDEVVRKNETLKDNRELFDCTPNYTRSGERADHDPKPKILR
jgi:hypothetical protein